MGSAIKDITGDNDKSRVKDKGSADSSSREIIWPKISLVTPSLNQGQFIEETILSVLSQNYPNLEYIIIDGGSTDETISVIRKYEKYLACWVSEPDAGQSQAINKGLALATGDIFNWLNADDQYENGALLKVAEAFLDHPEADVVYGIEKECFMDEPQREEFFSTVIRYTCEETLYTGHIIQSATFFRMETVRKLGPLREELHYLMDAEWWMRYLYRNGCSKVLYVNQLLTRFRVHEGSKTSTMGESFGKERRILQLSLARSLGIPEAVIRCSIGSEKTHHLYFEESLPDEQISPEKLKALFYRDSFIPLYVNSDFKNARKALLYYLRHGKVIITLSLLNYMLRILLVPAYVIMAARRRHTTKMNRNG